MKFDSPVARATLAIANGVISAVENECRDQDDLAGMDACFQIAGRLADATGLRTLRMEKHMARRVTAILRENSGVDVAGRKRSMRQALLRIIDERELWPGTRLLLTLERLLDPSAKMISAMETVEAHLGRRATSLDFYLAAVRQLLEEHIKKL